MKATLLFVPREHTPPKFYETSLWCISNRFPQIDWNQPAQKIHDFIRGMDKVPGAWTEIDGQVCIIFGSFGYQQRALYNHALSIVVGVGSIGGVGICAHPPPGTGLYIETLYLVYMHTCPWYMHIKIFSDSDL